MEVRDTLPGRYGEWVYRPAFLDPARRLRSSKDDRQQRLGEAVRRAQAEPSGELAAWSTRIERERQRLIADHSVIKVLAPGPGGTAEPVEHEKDLGELTSRISSSPSRARLLYSLIEEFRPKVAIEMGSGVGVSTAYQAAACAVVGTRMTCLEGAPDLARVAGDLVGRLDLARVVDIRVGWFDDTLPKAIAKGVDYAYVDGHHQEEPTLRYHELLVQHARPGAVLVYDDIRWSDGMKSAWKTISADNRVAVALDLKWRGVVLLP